ncbi:MAG: efflux RND transporter periplasmic adaptor subunit [Candidatus Eisenbacteria bacterium]|uniref:Efflux RND transporter periplasmic adaptor subunit n=1 Tax=Eiseniibacteriota bacterium TaxID=2212470 RepID=A0A933SAR9_UNCEI|nr:efflux RND transporter periplasmic adaptor subunit [Candidatus Eisenbacteria bacterium]
MDRRTIGVAMAAAAAVLALAGCAKEHDAPATVAPVVQVTTAPVDSAELSRPVLGSGLLAGQEEVPLAFKIGGVVARVDAEDGQVVRAGARLATLELTEIGALVDKAKVGLEKAERDLARARALHADSVVTREMLETAQSARDAAAADFASARFNARYASVVAPSDGVVLRRLAEPGATVAPGTPIVLFASASRGQVVRLGVPDRDVVRLRAGDAAEVRFDAWPGRVFAGRVTTVGAAATPGVGTYEIEIRLDDPVRLHDGGAAASGLVADVTITPARRQAVKLVPIEALLEGDSDRAHVWTLGADGAPARRDVRVAFLDGDRAAIASGLDGVTEVVTRGAAYLSEGSRVERSAK